MSDDTLIDVLASRAAACSQRVFCKFLDEGSTEAGALTYGELYQRAMAIAAELQGLNAAGERALLLYPAGLDFLAAFFGCLFAGAIAIPAPAPESSRIKRAAPRLRAIADDAAAAFVLTTRAIRTSIDQSQVPLFGDLAVRWVDTDQVSATRGSEWQRPAVGNRHLAYLQYTSGTTAEPRGVMISHRNLVDQLGYLQNTCGYTPDSVSVTWMPHYHDYGLIEGLLEPLFNGTQVVMMTPLAFVKRPSRWLQAISRYGATHSQAPNFAYDQCVRRVPPQDRVGLELGTWRAAGVAAEPINPRVMRAFHAAFEPHGFSWNAVCPAYGLAEATLMVSFSPQEEPPLIKRFEVAALERRRVIEMPKENELSRELVGCGRLFGGTEVAIVDPETGAQCELNSIGEIWVSDNAIAEGYWRRPEETCDTFRAHIIPTGEGPYLRTGDLGFIRDGQLFVAGRLKDVIIIHGVNHYPQEIEWTMQSAHAALRPENGAAFSVMIDNEEKLILVQELEQNIESADEGLSIIQSIRGAVVSEHGIDAHAVLLLRRGGLPKTTSGKIQRSACRVGFAKNRLDSTFSWSASDRKAAPGIDRTAPGSATQASVGLTWSISSSAMRRDLPPQPDHTELDRSRQRADHLIGWLREYAESRINSRLIDERRCIPPYIILDFGNHGVMGMQVSDRYGGLALRHADALRTLEQLAAIDLTLATLVFLNNTNGIRPIQNFATDTLREELLPRLAQGRDLAAFALSEPGAGSSLGSLSTIARESPGGGWCLSGVKRWNGSSWASVINVFARVTDANGRLGGLTGFVVRHGVPGFRVGPESLTMGLRGSVQNALYLEDVRVGPESLLGQVRDGMTIVEDALRVSRLCTAAVSIGGMKRCAQLMVRCASRRQIVTGRLLDNPLTLAKVSGVVARIAATESLAAAIARKLDDNEDCPPEIAMVAKVAGTDFLNATTAELMQLLGGRGYMENNIAPQLVRDARSLSIGEGPNEGLTMHVGRTEGQTQSVSLFLQKALGDVQLAATLHDASQAVLSRCQSLHEFADAAVRAQWGHILIGELAIEAVLLASLRRGNCRDAPRLTRLAIDWAQARFDAALDREPHGFGAETSVLTPNEAANVVAAYDLTVGDIEERLAGEDHDIDPLLKRSMPRATDESLSMQSFGGSSVPAQQSIQTSVTDRLAQLSPTAKREMLKRMLKQEVNAEINQRV